MLIRSSLALAAAAFVALAGAPAFAAPETPPDAANPAPTFAPPLPVPPEHAADEAAIRAILETYEKSWNTKDAKTLGSLYAEDADFSSIYGQKLRGRTVIADKHGILFQGAHKESQQSRPPSGVEIRFLRPDVACVDSFSEITNVILQSGKRSSMNRFLTSMVFVKNPAGVWEIAVFHNMSVPLLTPPSAIAAE